MRPHEGLLIGDRVRLTRRIGSGGMADVWVADHLTLGNEVAVKFVRCEDDPSTRERFKREAQLAARIDHPHAVRMFDHGVTADGTPYLVMELVDGETLAERIRRAGALRASEVATLVDQIADVLAHAHGKGILHRDIKPHNVMLLRGDRLFVKVLDFGLAKAVLDGDMELTQTGWLVGTPAYMAPEQLVEAKPATERSDQWGLSILAYEALTTERPFRGHSQAAIALGILVARYEPASKLRPELSPQVDAWFARAFDADPEKRFPNVRALSDAFVAALEGASDRTFADGRIRVSRRLYGRERELATIERALESTKERSQALWIEGYAGVGKTALVEEARRRMSQKGIVFVDGKLDQYNRGAPYDGIVQALKKLVRFVHQKDTHSADAWRGALRETLTEVAPVLVELLPGIEELLGRQPSLADASPDDARHRLYNAVSRLLHQVARPDRPLVVFIDDLQWADAPSIDLISRLTSDPGARHVLIIGSYRGDEVFAGDALSKATESGTKISLGPLDEDAIHEVLTDVLGPISGRVRLALVCQEKTRGNPFFLRRFLDALHEEGILVFDRSEAQWTWDTSKVRSRRVGDDVVGFITAELARLPSEVSACLAAASCIGGEFDLDLLASLVALDRRRTLDLLRPALFAHLVTPASDADLDSPRVLFRFAHDRIHQAARSLIDDTRAAELHQKIGARLLELDQDEREERVFEIVDHLNKSASPDRALSMRLNLAAARRALRAAAFESAAQYYDKALALFDASQWTSDYPTAFALHVEAARTVSGEAAERLVKAACEHARTDLDRTRAREVSIDALMREQRFVEAVALALELLAELGAPIPAEPSDEDTQRAVGRALSLMQRGGIDALPPCRDPNEIAAQRIRQTVMSGAYLSAPRVFPLLTTEIIRSTIEHGFADQSGYGFAVFAMVLNAIGMIDLSYESGKIALALAARGEDRSTLAKTRHVVYAHVNPFVERLADSIELERGVYHTGLANGDLEYASWALHIMVIHGFFAGMPLDELRDLERNNRALLERYRQLPALACTLPVGIAIARCMGGTYEGYDEQAHIAELQRVGFHGAAFVWFCMRAFTRFLLRDLTGAIESADAGYVHRAGVVATYHQVMWHEVRALAVLGARGAEGLDEARSSLAELERWCSFSPINHTHRVALVRAEIARVEERDADALAGYAAAIEHARAQRFLHEEAIANELAARFYLSRRAEPPARAYLLEAIDAYEAWGARAKIAQLEAELGDLLRKKTR
jgi:predicted ATPase